jgi:KaiC/GvpD/RAD55 family RecA-like ATPase
MKPSTLLKRTGIDSEERVLLITAEEAMENLLKAIEEFCPHLKINKMKKENIEALLDSYSDSIINYHPENYHQERAALLENIEMLKSYGLTNDDYNSIDFC